MSDSSKQLLEADHRHLWHPFTQQQGWVGAEAPIVASAKGSYLVDTAGRSYLDGVSSLWCNVHGHRHPTIDAAIAAQLDRVAHSTMLGLTHEPAIRLAERLAALSPEGLERIFYSDNGSTACEVALKMALQFWQQQGADRRRFVCLTNAYHGDTLGSVSVGGIDVFHERYSPLLFDALRVDPGDVDAMERTLAQNAGEIAAVIVEPLVQGAAGMLLQPDGYLRAVRELCDRYKVLLICDEVAVGFGRTGTMFACEQEAVSPDMLCLAKGLTGGYLPLAATLTTERIYNGFLGSYADFRTFFHGHTYTGNPLACAAALATLEIFETEGTLDQLQPKIELFARKLAELAQLDSVAEVRQRGLMCGVELAGFSPADHIGQRVTERARQHGAVVRPLGDVVILMPPLSISEFELGRLVEITGRAISEATAAYSS